MLIILVVVLVVLYLVYNQNSSPTSVNPHPHAVCFDLMAAGVMWKVDFSTSRVWRLANQRNAWIEFHMWRADAQNWSLRLSDHAWHALRQEFLTPKPGDSESRNAAFGESELGDAPDWKVCPAELRQLLELRYQYLHSGYTHGMQYQQYAYYQQYPPELAAGQPTGPAQPRIGNVYAPPSD